MEKPKSTAAPKSQCQNPIATHAARDAAITICVGAPGIATPFTRTRSCTEKLSPTPNMRSMTPISASCSIILELTGGNPGRTLAARPARM